MKSLNTLDVSPLADALETLREALSKPPANDLERDGVIQRFEYCFELSWKAIRVLLIAMGRREVSNSPKPLLRDAFEEGLISDVGIWFEFLEARNSTTHSYSRHTADEVYVAAQKFLPQADNLMTAILKKQKSTR